jgi:serine/threonine-protein kinase
MASTATSLFDNLRQVLDPDYVTGIERKLRGRMPADPSLIVVELVQAGKLTPYQADRLLANDTEKLVLGDYVLLDRLAEGGMGEIFKARHRKMGRIVAIKLLLEVHTNDKEFVRRFHREMRILGGLAHPNIVRAIDANTIGDKIFLIMEFIEGTDLQQLVEKNGPLSVAEACDYIRQTCLGLQHAVEKGLVHRDIKPANLVLTTANTIKILDLGLARLAPPTAKSGLVSQITSPDLVIGTPTYIAPEQARDSHGADTRADLYALGGTLFFLLTGRPPFVTAAATDMLFKHWFETPPTVRSLRPEVPVAVSGVVAKLLAKKPEDRYPSPAHLSEALRQAVEHPNTMIAPPPPPPPRPASLATVDMGYEEAVGALSSTPMLVMPPTNEPLPAQVLPPSRPATKPSSAAAPALATDPHLSVPTQWGRWALVLGGALMVWLLAIVWALWPSSSETKLPPGVIRPTEARKFMDRMITVEFRISEVNRTASDRYYFLQPLIASSKPEDQFKIVVPQVIAQTLGGTIEQIRGKLIGKRLRVTGRVTEYQGVAQIKIENETDLTLVD